METGQKTIQKSNKIDTNSNLELSIQVSLNGLSFCVLSIPDNTITYYNKAAFDSKLNPFQILDKLKHCFNTIPELNTTFSKVNVIHENELSSIVPKSLFNEDTLADYLKFNSKILRTDFITFDDINLIDAANVYVPYVNINNFIYDTFGAFEYNHFSTILLNTILKLNKNTIESEMYVHVSDVHFEIIVAKNGKLELYNSFEYTTKEDFIYYILFTAEQLNLNPEEFKLYLCGNIQEESDLYKIVYTYVRHVEIIDSQLQPNIANEYKLLLQSDYILKHSF